MTTVKIHKQKIKTAFSQAAKHYDNHANLQQLTCDRLLQYTQTYVKSADTIIDMGCGTGYAINTLVDHYPHADIIAVDFSLPMLNLAELRKNSYQLCADFDHLPLALQCADLIFSNLSIQWSFDVEKTLGAWKDIIKPRGYICLSSLAHGTLQELHQARSALGLATNAAHFMTVEQIFDITSRHFTVRVLSTETVTLAFPDIWTVAKSLQLVGAKAMIQDSRKQKLQGLMGRRYWHTLDMHYPRCQQTGTYPLSYELVYAILQVDKT